MLAEAKPGSDAKGLEMGRVRRTAASREDLIDIWAYVAGNASATIADHLIDTIEDKVALLADHPRAGTACPELRPRVRRFPVGSYVIYYRPARGGIELLRVLHGAREVRAVFRKRRER